MATLPLENEVPMEVIEEVAQQKHETDQEYEDRLLGADDYIDLLNASDISL